MKKGLDVRRDNRIYKKNKNLYVYFQFLTTCLPYIKFKVTILSVSYLKTDIGNYKKQVVKD